MTTIKVPRDLRDRLAVRAGEQRTTLAGALASALDEADERAFWVRVRADNASLNPSLRVEYAAFDSALGDDLADPADGALSPADW